MKIKVSQLRKFMNEVLVKLMEDHTAHSVESGYSDQVEETAGPQDPNGRDWEDPDFHMQGSEEEYQNYKKAYDAALKSKDQQPKKEAFPTKDPRLNPQSAQSSAALHTRDKSQMQGVGQRPSMANAFEPIGGQNKPVKQEAPVPPGMSTQSQRKSNPLKATQMQGVGPRPSLANAFDAIGGTTPQQDPAKQDPMKQEASNLSLTDYELLNLKGLWFPDSSLMKKLSTGNLSLLTPQEAEEVRQEVEMSATNAKSDRQGKQTWMSLLNKLKSNKGLDEASKTDNFEKFVQDEERVNAYKKRYGSSSFRKHLYADAEKKFGK